MGETGGSESAVKGQQEVILQQISIRDNKITLSSPLSFFIFLKEATQC